MIFATVTSYAATYETNSSDASLAGSVSTPQAADKTTVLIYKGAQTDSATARNIVYIDEVADTFTAETKFLIKSSAAANEGLYTVSLGDGSGTVIYDTFYIGMGEASGDLPMNRIAGAEGINEITADNGSKSYNIGYTVTVDLDGYKSIIIKTKSGQYMGLNFPIDGLTGSGNALYGIQINGVATEDGILGVWLSSKEIANGTAQ